MKRRKKNFCGIDQRSMLQTVSTRDMFSLGWPIFANVVFMPCSAVPETKEAAKLGEAFLHASNHTNHLQISPNMPLKVHVLQSIQNNGHCVITLFYFQRVGHRNGCIFQTSVNQDCFDAGSATINEQPPINFWVGVKTQLC